MTALLIVAHAPLASALGAVARHTYAECATTLAALDVTPQMAPEDAQAQVAAAVAGFGAEAEVLILTDVFGATPCNVAQRVADGQRVRVLAGVNVPMLWRTLCYQSEPIASLVERAQSGATQGVLQASPNRPQHQNPRATTDAEGHRHDQQ
jgi:mannose PTS system EIIA component